MKTRLQIFKFLYLVGQDFLKVEFFQSTFQKFLGKKSNSALGSKTTTQTVKKSLIKNIIFLNRLTRSLKQDGCIIKIVYRLVNHCNGFFGNLSTCKTQYTIKCINISTLVKIRLVKVLN